MTLRGEHDGTGKPNFDKFKTDYISHKAVKLSAVQFHPGAFAPEHFTEYSKILDFLISEGWTFMLPTEYLSKAGLAHRAGQLHGVDASEATHP